MSEKTKYHPRVLCLFLSLALVAAALAAGVSASAGDDLIMLVAPEILSGESLIKIGDTKYIRYTVALDESEARHYAEINFSVTFDDAILDLAFTNINLKQIYAYDVTGGAGGNTQRNIIFYEPQLDGNRINVSAYSTTGMWFLEGIVIILYFLPREGIPFGEVGGVRLGDFSCKIITEEGGVITPPEGSLKTLDGGVTLTEEKSFSSGGTAAPQDTDKTNSPFPGRGDEGAINPLPSENDRKNAPLYYTIAAIIFLGAAAIALWGIQKIRRVLRYSRPRKKDDKDTGDEQ